MEMEVKDANERAEALKGDVIGEKERSMELEKEVKILRARTHTHTHTHTTSPLFRICANRKCLCIG